MPLNKSDRKPKYPQRLKQAEEKVDNAFAQVFDLHEPALLSFDEIRKSISPHAGRWVKDIWDDEKEELEALARKAEDTD